MRQGVVFAAAGLTLGAVTTAAAIALPVLRSAAPTHAAWLTPRERALIHAIRHR